MTGLGILTVAAEAVWVKNHTHFFGMIAGAGLGGVKVCREMIMANLVDRSLGVPNAVAVVVILVYRTFSFWLPSLVGFPLIPVLQRATGQAAPGIGTQ